MNDDIIYRLKALAQDVDGTVTPFVLRVARPRLDPARGHYYRIECPHFCRKRHWIFGVDETHACKMPIHFIRKLLDGTGVHILDSENREVPSPAIAYNPDAKLLRLTPATAPGRHRTGP